MAREPLIAQEPLPNGEARLYRGTYGQRIFEVEYGARLFRASLEPRETGEFFLVQLDRWTDPAEPLLDEDHGALLDALWALATKSGSVDAIVEERPALGTFVAVRWRRGADGLLVRVRSESELEVLLLGRTMRVPVVTDPRGPRVARIVRPDAARWTIPADGEVTPKEWSEIQPRLAAARAGDFLLTDPGWSIAFADRPAPE